MSESTDDRTDDAVRFANDIITLDMLPPSTATRWVTSRKAQLIAAIKGGLITIEEASRRYCLTIEELGEWQSSFDRHGKRGLRTTFTQQYRFLRGVNHPTSDENELSDPSQEKGPRLR